MNRRKYSLRDRWMDRTVRVSSLFFWTCVWVCVCVCSKEGAREGGCVCVCICMCVGGRDRRYEPITPFSSISFIFVFSYKKFPYFLSTVSSFIHCFSFISFSFHYDVVQISFFHLIILNSELHVCVPCVCLCVFLYFVLIRDIISSLLKLTV